MIDDRRAALLTGASSGIGLSVAHMLVRLGYDLTVVGRDQDKLDAAQEALGRDGVQTISADLSAPDSVDGVLTAHLERWGRLDVLVHSAGVGLFGELGAQSDKRIDLQIDLNLRSLTRLVSHGLPHLEKAGAEHGKALVAVISSMVGVLPQPGVVPYAATKAAQVAFCAGAHAECADRGVQFTAICPAIVDTPGASWANAGAQLSPDDVAETVRYLLSTSRACFVPEIHLLTSEPFRIDA